LVANIPQSVVMIKTLVLMIPVIIIPVVVAFTQLSHVTNANLLFSLLHAPLSPVTLTNVTPILVLAKQLQLVVMMAILALMTVVTLLMVFANTPHIPVMMAMLALLISAIQKQLIPKMPVNIPL